MTVSKSSSTAEPGVHVRVDAVVGVLGVSATLDKTGAVLSMTMLAITGVPLSVPSLGVTEQVTVSPPTKLPEMLVDVPTTVPPMLQETVLTSLSPSSSVNPDHAHVSVSAAYAVVGVMDAETSEGAEF